MVESEGYLTMCEKVLRIYSSLLTVQYRSTSPVYLSYSALGDKVNNPPPIGDDLNIRGGQLGSGLFETPQIPPILKPFTYPNAFSWAEGGKCCRCRGGKENQATSVN